MDLNQNWLKQIGFEDVAKFILRNDKLEVFPEITSNEKGVYVFLLNNEIVYVGKTEDKKGLQNRIGLYLIGHKSQKTNKRVKELIKKSLIKGKRIQILFLKQNKIKNLKQIEFYNFGIHLTLKLLERILIEKIKPIWNRN